MIEPTRTDPVRPLLVFLHLAEREAEMPAERSLAQTELHPARPEPASDMSVNVLGRCKIPGLIDPSDRSEPSSCDRRLHDHPRNLPLHLRECRGCWP